jgi:hypothetical protein
MTMGERAWAAAAAAVEEVEEEGGGGRRRRRQEFDEKGFKKRDISPISNVFT